MQKRVRTYRYYRNFLPWYEAVFIVVFYNPWFNRTMIALTWIWVAINIATSIAWGLHHKWH